MTRGQRWLFTLLLALAAGGHLGLPARLLGTVAMGGVLVSLVGLAGALGSVSRRRP